MPQTLAQIALLVRDYDEAIAFYRDRLGFVLVEDSPLPVPGKRWVVMAPSGGGSALLLARATSPRQEAAIGDQSGGRVFLFLQTDDFERDYKAFRDRGVRFVRPPETMDYGRVAVFEDLYGSLWDLVEYRR